MCVVLAGAWLYGQPALAQPRGFDGYQVVRVHVQNDQQLATLKALDLASTQFEVWSDVVDIGIVEVRVSPAQRQTLDNSGLEYEPWIDDLQDWYDHAFSPGPADGFFDTYHTYDETVDFLNSLAATHPDLAEIFNAGSSVLGRPLWGIRITGPTGTDKPGVLCHGGQHGNEIMGTAAVSYMADYLLSHYDDDPIVADAVDDVEWFLIPIMNPDGYEFGSRHNAHGIDLNRNWDGPGAGQDPSGGPFPFSEPETSAVRDLMLAHPNLRSYIDFHTFGYLIMWPWGHTPALCEDHPTFGVLGGAMAERIHEVNGVHYRIGPGYTTIYPTFGASDGFSYGIMGLWGFTFELGYSHLMPPTMILPISEEAAAAMLYLSQWTADCNENGVADADDIAGGTSDDCNVNRTPDECEPQPDFDGDGWIDLCDDDMDDDGVPNDSDICNDTLPGLPILSDGSPIADSNGDCWIDLVDLERFRVCLLSGGPDMPPSTEVCVERFDHDGDLDVDLADWAGLQRAFNPGGGLGVCGFGGGDCFAENESPGCERSTCCRQVCIVDQSCCDQDWDGRCASLARALCDD
jgi:hypothetical protein